MIQKLLDISTAHILESTAQWLNNTPGDLILYPKAEYGWFIYTGSEEFPEDTPEELANAIIYAESLGCHWLVLDRDGEIINELPSFDW